MEIEAPMWGFGNVNIIKPVKALKGAVKSFLLHFLTSAQKLNMYKFIILYVNSKLY